MDSDELRALVAVGTTGSFQAAAHALGLPRSTLRRRIEQLEARVGAPLVRAAPDGAKLTAAGERVLQRGQAVLREIESMLDHVRMEDGGPVGQLRVGLPVGAPPEASHPVVSLWRQTFPKLRVRVRVFECPSAAPAHELDAFLDFSLLPPPHGWEVVDLGPADEVLLASPSYLAARGTPASVEDLREHDLLTWIPPDRESHMWPRADGTVFETSPMMTTPDMHVLRLLASQGMGIILLPDPPVPGLTPAAFNLVPVLPTVVRHPRRFTFKVSGEVAAMPVFRGLLDSIRAFVERGR